MPEPQPPVSQNDVQNDVQNDYEAPVLPAPEPLPERSSNCPADKTAASLLPGVTDTDFDIQNWNNSKRVIMNHDAIVRHNARFMSSMSDLDKPADRREIEENLKARLKSFREKFENDEIMFVDGSKPPAEDWERPLAEFNDHWTSYSEKQNQYILLEDSMILCGPHDQPYIKTQNGEIRFSRNNCSLGRAQGRVEIIFTQSNGMRFVRTRDMWGWLSPNAKLSPVLDGSEATGERDARWFTQKEMTLAGMTIPKGAFLAGSKSEVSVATPDGFVKFNPANIEHIVDTHRPLTQKAWIETLFLFINDPYGWGGHGGFRDCSRILLDAARSFNLWLPRNSKEQAVMTDYYFKVAGIAPEDKLKTIEDAAKTGIVFLHFPGHIMAWLGRSKSGEPIILHSLSEYIEACPEGAQVPDGEKPESLVHVDKVTLSNLSLGQGSSRTSFLERITHISVLTTLSRKSDTNSPHPWESSRDWTPEEETLFASFVERLFDYPDEPDKSWTNLGDVLKDSKHNILYNAFGEHEDDNLKLAPDCADLPYMLRSYFAWKRGLPMASRKCGRGTGKSTPKCGSPAFQHDKTASGPAARRFNQYATYLGAYEVHSGNARTALADDNTDFYPVELTRNSLRPGTTFADPHGHLLVIAHYTPDTKESPGALLSVDAQPDGTITRKRFWKGNFLFAPEIKSVGAGFKAFRPIVNGHQLTNRELNIESGFVPYSTEQAEATRDSFYDRVEAAIHPTPLDIKDAVAELTNALLESAQRRVNSVQTGDDYARENGTSMFVMPRGYAVFETQGPWEDYATPSRDMRMLIAIDAVRDFPAQIERNAQRYKLNSEEEIQKAVAYANDVIREALETAQVSYQNSLGQTNTITLKDVVDRVEDLEMGYHPADCNEIRWGAPQNSEEMKTCSRSASDTERAKMLEMRTWFHQRMRPMR